MEIKVSVKDISEVIEQLQKAKEKINNLQSKIDKAIEYIEENGYNVSNNILLDILKEDK